MNATRSELLGLLAELSEAAPDQRLGQLIANLSTLARGAEIASIWDSEDEELSQSARRLLKRYQLRETCES